MKEPIDKLYIAFIAHDFSKVTLQFTPETLRTWNVMPEDKTGRAYRNFTDALTGKIGQKIPSVLYKMKQT